VGSTIAVLLYRRQEHELIQNCLLPKIGYLEMGAIALLSLKALDFCWNGLKWVTERAIDF